MYIRRPFFLQRRNDALCHALQLCLWHFFQYLFDNDHAVFIHSGNEIAVSVAQTFSDHFHRIGIFSLARFNDHYGTRCFHLNTQLFGPAVNIYQKQVVQKQVFDKVVLIKPLFICNHQILDLKCCHFTDHIDILSGADSDQHIFCNLFIINLKELVFGNLLAVRR